MNLYEMNEEMQMLIDAFEYAEDTAELQEAVAQLQMERAEKIENIGKWIKSLTASIEEWKKQENKVKKERQAMENKVLSLKAYLGSTMGKGKLKTPFVTIPANLDVSAVCDVKVSELPEEYVTVRESKSFNSAKAKADLEAGKELPFAHLVKKKRVE